MRLLKSREGEEENCSEREGPRVGKGPNRSGGKAIACSKSGRQRGGPKELTKAGGGRTRRFKIVLSRPREEAGTGDKEMARAPPEGTTSLKPAK